MRGVSIFYNAKLGNICSSKILKNSIVINFENLTIIASYFHPKLTSTQIWDELTETLQYIEHHDRAIFAGDYNCRLDIKCAKKELMHDFIDYSDLNLANAYPLEYTYEAVNGKSVVDLILCGSKIKKQQFKVEDTHLRKHRVVQLSFSISNLNAKTSKISSKQ